MSAALAMEKGNGWNDVHGTKLTWIGSVRKKIKHPTRAAGPKMSVLERW
jgi:hypothetical protein